MLEAGGPPDANGLSDGQQAVPTFVEVDERLREALRGRRLVVEAGLDLPLLRELEGVVRQATRTMSVSRLARLHPALFLGYLTTHGIFRYEAGGFWNHDPLRLHHQGIVDDIARALRALELESFDRMVVAEGAQSGVSRLLAHGGIPRYSLDDFFEVLVPDASRSNGVASDLMAYWATRPSRFVNRDKPIKRFLDYGGSIAIDFLDRCLDLVEVTASTASIPTSESVGLPSHVVAAFEEFVRRRPQELKRQHHGARLPRPVVRIDPWGGEGPRVDLPPVADDLRDGRWNVSGGGGARCSTLEWQSVALGRAGSWSVALDDRGTRHEWVIGGLDGEVPMLAFDAERSSVVNLDRALACDDVILLIPSGSEVRTRAGASSEPASDIEGLPLMAGEWGAYQLRWIDLGHADGLEVEHEGAVRRLRVRGRSGAVHIEGRPCPGVSANGLPVYSVPPMLALPEVPGLAVSAWAVQLVVNGDASQFAVADLPEQDGGFSLASRLPAGVSEIDVRVRGPLGSDLRESFVVVPGLEVHRPDRLVMPGDRNPAVDVSAPGCTSEGRPVVHRRIELPPDQTAAAIELVDQHERATSLRVEVDRLQWAISTSPAAVDRFGASTSQIAHEDLVGARGAVLRVRCGDRRPELLLQLVASDGTVLDESDRQPDSATSGRWTFQLDAFADTLRAADTGALALCLWAGTVPVTVARIVAPVTARIGSVESSFSHGIGVVQVAFEDPRPVRERTVRLWSLARPWTPVVIEPIDEAATQCQLERSADDLPPGPYLVEVAVDDGWTTPVRPTSCDSDAVVRVDIGTNDQLAAHIERLNVSVVRDVVERTLLTGVLDRELTDEELCDVAPDLADLLTDHYELNRNNVRVPTGFRPAMAMLRVNPAGLAHGLNEFAARFPNRRWQLRGLAVSLLTRTKADVQGIVADREMAELWQTCPPIAARLELVPNPSGERTDRLERYLGWHPDQGPDAVVADGALEQQLLGMAPDMLAALLAGSSLVPERILDGGTAQEAQAEWLIRNAATAPDVDPWGRSTSLAERWMSRHHGLLRGIDQAPLVAQSHVRARLLPNVGTTGPLGWGSLPAVTLAAALHVLLDDEDRPLAMGALADAASFAPRLVDRDLVLAQVVLPLDSDEASSSADAALFDDRPLAPEDHVDLDA